MPNELGLHYAAYMDKSEYDQIKAEIIRRRETKIQTVDSEMEAEMKSLDLIWDLSQEIGIPMKATRTIASDSLEFPVVRNRPSSPVSRVREVIRNLHGDFGNREISSLLYAEGSKSMESKDISSALNKLNKQGEIEQIAPGKGRRPAVYRKVER